MGFICPRFLSCFSLDRYAHVGQLRIVLLFFACCVSWGRCSGFVVLLLSALGFSDCFSASFFLVICSSMGVIF